MIYELLHIVEGILLDVSACSAFTPILIIWRTVLPLLSPYGLGRTLGVIFEFILDVTSFPMDLNLEEWRTGAMFSCMNNEVPWGRGRGECRFKDGYLA